MIQKGVRVDSVVTLAGLIKIILHLRNPKIIEIKMACVCLVPVTLVENKIRKIWQIRFLTNVAGTIFRSNLNNQKTCLMPGSIHVLLFDRGKTIRTSLMCDIDYI